VYVPKNVPKFKKEKYEEELQQLISEFIRKQISDPRLTFISITKVELSGDYKEAKAYWDTFDSNRRGDAKQAIDKIASKVRSHLSHSLKVRQVPSVKFFYDAQFESEKEIERLLAEEKSNNN
jgi:ribosome-binding factor A